MPGSSNTVSNTPSRDAFTDGYNISNGFMACSAGKYISQDTLLDEEIGVTNATSNDFDQNVACFGLFELDILQNKVFVRGSEDGGFVRLG